MAPRTFEDHVQSLIGRTVAEAKVVGSNSPDIEARAIIESVALNLLLKPKAVYYLANLSRNALRNVVTKEIAAVDSMSKTVTDLGNTTFTPASSQHLDRARTALLQMEGLEKIDSRGSDFLRFSRSIDDFLNKSLGKSVRKLGETDLSRPDSEAAADLPSDFSSLSELHSDLNGRLFSLSVGIENFVSSPLGTILGLATAYRARTDIEDIIDIINRGESSSQLRDIAIRVIGDRAALKSTGSFPVLDSPLIDTANELPSGYVLKARSDPATVSTTGSIAPFTFAASATASVTVNGFTLVETHFPQSLVHLNNRAFVVSDPGVSFPVTIPAGYYLFLHLRRLTAASGYDLQEDGSYLKQLKIPITSGSRTLAQILTDLDAGLGSEGDTAEYLSGGTGRFIVIANSPIVSISVVASIMEPSTSTIGDFNVFTKSLHTILNFPLYRVGSSGSTPISIIIDALNRYFNGFIVASPTDEQRVKVSTVADSIGTSMTLALDSSLGLTGTFTAKSDILKLYGTVFGKEPTPIPGDVPTPVDPIPLLDVGDILTTPSGDFPIQNLTTTRIILPTAINTFDGDVFAVSTMATLIKALDTAVQVFLTSWLETPYASGLVSLDRAVAILSGKVTPATRQAVQDILLDLKTQLQALSAVLTIGTLSPSLGTEEKTIVDGIISTLTERKYDKALSHLLRLEIQEFFELTGETSSFGGALLKSMADMAQLDIKFPNTMNDEASGFKGLIKEPEA